MKKDIKEYKTFLRLKEYIIGDLYKHKLESNDRNSKSPRRILKTIMFNLDKFEKDMEWN